ncbi:MAG: thiamine phosphate synthase [Rhodobacteraceae bacterium]|nr:thiamine phosphate synthase [Paracoccaceae bacterium]
MAGNDRPRLYLITPAAIDLRSFPDALAAVLDSAEIACLRIALATRNAEALARAADTLREVAHARDVAVVIDTHVRLVVPHGLDGVHLGDGARSVREARRALGAEAIVGAFCGTSRHDGLTAGEAGADYVSFGPVGDTGLGPGRTAPQDLFAWWSEMIEVPVVAEGGLDAESVAALAPVTDFLGIGEEIWSDEDPAGALGALLARIG